MMMILRATSDRMRARGRRSRPPPVWRFRFEPALTKLQGSAYLGSGGSPVWRPPRRPRCCGRLRARSGLRHTINQSATRSLLRFDDDDARARRAPSIQQRLPPQPRRQSVASPRGRRMKGAAGARRPAHSASDCLRATDRAR
eukprot:scaffold3300_cov269-Prasinococcus_capsulatus_cf.AAC.4